MSAIKLNYMTTAKTYFKFLTKKYWNHNLLTSKTVFMQQSYLMANGNQKVFI